MENEYVIALTFGDCAENHAGMQKLGKIKEKGMNLDDLKNTQNILWFD